MRVFIFFIISVTILYIVTLFIIQKLGAQFTFISVTFNYLFLIILFSLNKVAYKLCLKNKNEKGSEILKSLNIASSFNGVLSSWIIISLISAYYTYVKGWMMNIGGHNNGLVINKPYILLILIPITTFLISKFVWNKNKIIWK